MDEQRDSELQLNKEVPAEEQFSLEDILREFGGWTKPEEPEEPAAAPVKEEAPAPESPPESEIMRVAASEKQEKAPVTPLMLSGDTVRFMPVSEEPENVLPATATANARPAPPSHRVR